jgi:tRNA dimethylallyltransferase
VKANRERREELEQIEQSQPWYIRNLLNSFDPETAAEFHPKNTRYIIRAIEIYEQTGIPKSILVRENPVDHPLLMVSLTRDVDTANRLIHQRVEEMIERGLVAEVQWLLDHGYSPELQSMNGIGYKQTIEILNSKWEILNNAKLVKSISLASVQYAKRQRTRFRRYEKDGREHPKDRVFYMQIDMW